MDGEKSSSEFAELINSISKSILLRCSFKPNILCFPIIFGSDIYWTFWKGQ